MTNPPDRTPASLVLILVGISAACAACAPMRQQIDENPAGYIVSSYSHRGATDGDGSQVFAMSTNPVAGSVESGAVYLESVNGDEFSVASTYAHPSSRASSFGLMDSYGWPQYSVRRGALLLNAPGSFNNHLVMLAPPPSSRPASSFPGNAVRPPSSPVSSIPRASVPRSMGSTSGRPAIRSMPRARTNPRIQERAR